MNFVFHYIRTSTNLRQRCWHGSQTKFWRSHRLWYARAVRLKAPVKGTLLQLPLSGYDSKRTISLSAPLGCLTETPQTQGKHLKAHHSPLTGHENKWGLRPEAVHPLHVNSRLSSAGPNPDELLRAKANCFSIVSSGAWSGLLGAFSGPAARD